MLAYLRAAAALGTGARLLLLSSAIWGVSQGITGVVFNLFLLAAGYDAAWIGSLVAATSLVSFAAAVPLGRAADRLGPRRAVIWGGTGGALGLLCSALWPAPAPLLASQVAGAAFGTAAWVAVAPLLSEYSEPDVRDLFFGLQFAVSTATSAVGNLVGGALPALAAGLVGAPPDSLPAYRLAVLAAAVLGLLAVAPVVRLRRPADPPAGAPGRPPELAAGALGDLRLRRGGLLWRFALPALLTGTGAGLLIPLLNVFFVRRFGAAAAEIGVIFSWSAAAVTVASAAGPALAARVGRVRAIAGSQLLSIPFLMAMAVAPGLWWAALASWVRAALMNLGQPLTSALMMQCFPPGDRATANAAFTMAWTLGWAAGAQAAGILMERVSPASPLWITAGLYLAAALAFHRFFAPLEGAGGSGRR